MSLAPGTLVRLRVETPGTVEDFIGRPVRSIPPSGTTVSIDGPTLETRATRSCQKPPGPSYALSKAVSGTWTEYQIIASTDPRCVKENTIIAHHELAAEPGNAPSPKLYEKGQLLFLLKAFTFDPKNPHNAKVHFKVGDAVILTSEARTRMGGPKQTLSGSMKPYYQIQLAHGIQRPKKWRSDLYYPVESNVFEVL